MPFQKPAEQGWFYHAPARVKNVEPIGVPPASQIPGLSDVSSVPMEQEKRTMFRDTDSDYVRLAKQGGRQDLLQNNYATRGRSKEAVDYPRVDWYYLEDNQAADGAQRPQDDGYKFMLPEYMVHEEYVDNNDTAGFRPKRAPYGYDRTQVYERESDPTKKDIKLPEVMRQGYGVRSEKLKNKPIPHNQPPPPKPIIHGTSTAHRTYKAVPNNECKERADMSKILSFDYSREWQQSRDVNDTSSQASWQKKQQQVNEKPNSRNGDIFSSEYQAGFSKPPPKAGRRSTPKSTTERGTLSPDQLGYCEDGRPPPKTAAQAVKKDVDADKELFKMARFKNVPARTDSHRGAAMVAGI